MDIHLYIVFHFLISIQRET